MAIKRMASKTPKQKTKSKSKPIKSFSREIEIESETKDSKELIHSNSNNKLSTDIREGDDISEFSRLGDLLVITENNPKEGENEFNEELEFSEIETDKEDDDDVSISSGNCIEKGNTLPGVATRAIKNLTTSSAMIEQETTDDSDDSEDEFAYNQIGNVPLEWYTENHDHIGYDICGRKIEGKFNISEIDSLIRSVDNPDAWRTILDLKNNREIRLTDTDLKIIDRIRKGRPTISSDQGYHVEFEDRIEHQIHKYTEDRIRKDSFGNRSDLIKITKLISLIRAGAIRPDKNKKGGLQKLRDIKLDFTKKVFDCWDPNNKINNKSKSKSRKLEHISMPKEERPLTEESYHPPEEYIPFNDEIEIEEEGEKEEEEGEIHGCIEKFRNQNFDCLRRVPGYENLLLERYMRCIEIHSCPRFIRKRNNIDPESILPVSPVLHDLMPFPTSVSLSIFLDHNSGNSFNSLIDDEMDISIPYSNSNDSIDSKFSSLVSASFNRDGDVFAAVLKGSVHICDVLFGIRIQGIDIIGTALAFHPIFNDVLAIGTYEGSVRIIRIDSLTRYENNKENNKNKNIYDVFLDVDNNDVLHSDGHAWVDYSTYEKQPVVSVCWHKKGRYLAVAQSDAVEPRNQAIIFDTLNGKSTRLIRGTKIGRAKEVLFHPTKPSLLVAFQLGVREYSLKADSDTPTVSQTYSLGSDMITSMTTDKEGGHICVSSENGALVWFDKWLGEKPWRKWKFHAKCARGVSMHSNYPLIATASDDGLCQVVHAKTYSDPSLNPVVIPVKVLKNTRAIEPIRDLKWHPTLPWLITVGIGGVVTLYA